MNCLLCYTSFRCTRILVVWIRPDLSCGVSLHQVYPISRHCPKYSCKVTLSNISFQNIHFTYRHGVLYLRQCGFIYLYILYSHKSHIVMPQWMKIVMSLGFPISMVNKIQSLFLSSEKVCVILCKFVCKCLTFVWFFHWSYVIFKFSETLMLGFFIVCKP